MSFRPHSASLRTGRVEESIKIVPSAALGMTKGDFFHSHLPFFPFAQGT
jgi:hypothetical protein